MGWWCRRWGLGRGALGWLRFIRGESGGAAAGTTRGVGSRPGRAGLSGPTAAAMAGSQHRDLHPTAAMTVSERQGPPPSHGHRQGPLVGCSHPASKPHVHPCPAPPLHPTPPTRCVQRARTRMASCTRSPLPAPTPPSWPPHPPPHPTPPHILHLLCSACGSAGWAGGAGSSHGTARQTASPARRRRLQAAGAAFRGQAGVGHRTPTAHASSHRCRCAEGQNNMGRRESKSFLPTTTLQSLLILY